MKLSSTSQKIKFSIKDFFSKCDQTRSFLRIWSHLLKKSFVENFIFCVVKISSCKPLTHFLRPDIFRGYNRTVAGNAEAVVRKCSVKNVLLKISQNSQENTCARFSFFFRPATLLKKEALPQVFPCEFCEIFKNTFFYRTSPVTTSWNDVLLLFRNVIIV